MLLVQALLLYLIRNDNPDKGTETVYAPVLEPQQIRNDNPDKGTETFSN